MRKTWLVVFALLLVTTLLVVQTPLRASAKGTVYVSREYLVDSDGYQYGVNFYANSTVGRSVYAFASILRSNNVRGDVVHGTIILRPNEKRFRVGSFICINRRKAWFVRINVRWRAAD